MADPILKLHKVTYTFDNESRTYFFLSNPLTYQGIGAESGVELASDNEQSNKKIDIGELLSDGELMRVKVGYKVTGGKVKYAQLIIPSTRVASFRKSMVGKTYRGGEVVSVRGVRRARFS